MSLPSYLPSSRCTSFKILSSFVFAVERSKKERSQSVCTKWGKPSGESSHSFLSRFFLGGGGGRRMELFLAFPPSQAIAALRDFDTTFLFRRKREKEGLESKWGGRCRQPRRQKLHPFFQGAFSSRIMFLSFEVSILNRHFTEIFVPSS